MSSALLALIALFGAPAAAQVTYTVTVNTSSVAGTTGIIDFEFNPGLPTPQLATAQIANFNPDGGSLSGAPTLIGDASGALPGTLAFDNVQFDNEYFQSINFGSQITFTLTLGGPAITAPNGSPEFSFFLSFYSAGFGAVILTNNTVAGVAGEVDILPNGSTVAYGYPNPTGGPSFVTFSQAPPYALLDGPVQVRYAANLAAGESYINIMNDGANGDPLLGPGSGAAGNICVNMYAFDARDEQEVSCCSCLITPNAVAHLGVNANLLATTVTGVMPSSVTVKLVATEPAAGFTGTSCSGSAGALETSTLATGMVAWGTTLQPAIAAGAFTTTQAAFLPVSVGIGLATGNNDLASISMRCASIIGNGSGSGICTSCLPGALGASKM